MPDMRLIDELISKYLQQNISDNETIELNKWIAESQENKVLFEKLTDSKYISDELDKFYQYDDSKGWNKVKASYSFNDEAANLTEGRKVLSMSTWKRIAVAASVLLIVGAGIFFYNSTKTHEQSPVAEVKLPTDVKPPQLNRATITLANGQLIYLDSANNGKLAQQGNVNVKKLGDGQIVYNGESSIVNSELVYNTLTNPRGSKVIDMTLSDGSRVWLNAGSSVTYPVAFAGSERKVTVAGEAYFEVAHNVAMPFKVSKGEMEVTALGTHFNVNAYDDEGDIKVTLLEGSVRASTGSAGQTVVLKPREQALTIGNGKLKVEKGVDVDAVMAWKNGYFSFSHTDLQAVMRQVARWYDVEIIYEDATPEMTFSGEITRDNNVSQVLKILEESKVKFRIEGKKITVVK